MAKKAKKPVRKCGCNPRLHYVVCTRDGRKGSGGRGFVHHKNKKC